MTTLAAEALLKWLALPIPPELTIYELDELKAIADRMEQQDPATAARLRALVAATTQETAEPAPAPSDDIARAMNLLTRGEQAAIAADEEMVRRAQAGEGSLPSPAVAETAGALDRLARSSQQLRDAGLSSVLSAYASGWMVAHSVDPLGSSTQTLLRIAIDQMIAAIPRRSLAQAFAALARAAATHGRADIWQAQVQHLMDRHGDDVPADLAWWVALRSAAVIRHDSRWFRAHRTREQAEALLDLPPTSDDSAAPDRLDAVRVELAVAYALNPDLDERPWIETVNEILRGLLVRLGQPGAEFALMRFGELIRRSGGHPEAKAEVLRSWATEAGAQGKLSDGTAEAIEAAALELDRLAAESEDVLVTVDTSQVPDDAPPGVPPGLYDEDPEVRRFTLARQFGAWAFSTAAPEGGDEFYEAVPILAELYTRGIADPVEDVREASVIFARRLIYGYSQRDRNDLGMVWLRRVLSDTATLTSPRCVRARVQALEDILIMGDDYLEKKAAADRLDAELAGNHADYAVIHRALLHEWRMKQLEPGPERSAALEAAIPLYIESIDNDEYESWDWPKKILEAVRERFLEIAKSGRRDAHTAEELTRLGEIYLRWMSQPPERYQQHMLGVWIIDELHTMTPLLDGEWSGRRRRVVDDAIRRLRGADGHLYELYRRGYHRFSEASRVVWPEDRGAAVARFEADMEAAAALLGTEPPDMTTAYGSTLKLSGRLVVPSDGEVGLGRRRRHPAPLRSDHPGVPALPDARPLPIPGELRQHPQLDGADGGRSSLLPDRHRQRHRSRLLRRSRTARRPGTRRRRGGQVRAEGQGGQEARQEVVPFLTDGSLRCRPLR